MFFNFKLNEFQSGQSDVFACPNSKIIVQGVWPNFTIDTLLFNKTVKIHDECSKHEGDQPVNFFYSRNVGLIRKELLNNNEVWKLVNYHIIQ
jgi:hypothetical protein